MKNNLTVKVLILLAVLMIVNIGATLRISSKQQAAVSTYSLDLNKSVVRPGTTTPSPTSSISTTYFCKKVSGPWLMPGEGTFSSDVPLPSHFQATFDNGAVYNCEKIS